MSQAPTPGFGESFHQNFGRNCRLRFHQKFSPKLWSEVGETVLPKVFTKTFCEVGSDSSSKSFGENFGRKLVRRFCQKFCQELWTELPAQVSVKVLARTLDGMRVLGFGESFGKNFGRNAGARFHPKFSPKLRTELGAQVLAKVLVKVPAQIGRASSRQSSCKNRNYRLTVNVGQAHRDK